MTPRVESLHIYPLKSAGAVDCDSVKVVTRGFAHDRRWMVVDPDGNFITQRAHPALAVIGVELGGETMRLGRAGARSLELPLELDAGAAVEVQVWADECDALDAGDEAARWLSEHLQTECRLVYMPDATERGVEANPASDRAIVSFADAYPFLLVERASLDDLNARLDEPVPMNRFRPNIVVGGTEAFAADAWSRIRIGEVVFRVAKPCARCVVTTVDQSTGAKAGGEMRAEPLRTLASYRTRDNKVMFGQNLIQECEGVVRVGDSVEVL